MPDEKDKLENGWTMPTPVFRTTEGRSVKSAADPESDIPTEQANRDIPGEPFVNVSSQAVPSIADHHSVRESERRKSFWEQNARGLIVLGLVLLGVLLYLVWLCRGTTIL